MDKLGLYAKLLAVCILLEYICIVCTSFSLMLVVGVGSKSSPSVSIITMIHSLTVGLFNVDKNYYYYLYVIVGNDSPQS